MDGVPYGVPFWKLYGSAGLYLRKKLRCYIDADFWGKSIFRIRFGLFSLYVSFRRDRKFQISTFGLGFIQNAFRPRLRLWMLLWWLFLLEMIMRWGRLIKSVSSPSYLLVSSSNIGDFDLRSLLNGFGERFSGWNGDARATFGIIERSNITKP